MDNTHYGEDVDEKIADLSLDIGAEEDWPLMSERRAEFADMIFGPTLGPVVDETIDWGDPITPLGDFAVRRVNDEPLGLEDAELALSVFRPFAMVNKLRKVAKFGDNPIYERGFSGERTMMGRDYRHRPVGGEVDNRPVLSVGGKNYVAGQDGTHNLGYLSKEQSRAMTGRNHRTPVRLEYGNKRAGRSHWDQNRVSDMQNAGFQNPTDFAQNVVNTPDASYRQNIIPNKKSMKNPGKIPVQEDRFLVVNQNPSNNKNYMVLQNEPNTSLFGKRPSFNTVTGFPERPNRLNNPKHHRDNANLKSGKLKPVW